MGPYNLLHSWNLQFALANAMPRVYFWVQAYLRNGFVKGNWCRLPITGTVGGPGGKPRGRRPAYV